MFPVYASAPEILPLMAAKLYVFKDVVMSAETWDWEFTDAFGLQSEIAENVAKFVAAKKT